MSAGGEGDWGDRFVMEQKAILQSILCEKKEKRGRPDSSTTPTPLTSPSPPPPTPPPLLTQEAVLF